MRVIVTGPRGLDRFIDACDTRAVHVLCLDADDHGCDGDGPVDAYPDDVYPKRDVLRAREGAGRVAGVNRIGIDGIHRAETVCVEGIAEEDDDASEEEQAPCAHGT